MSWRRVFLFFVFLFTVGNDLYCDSSFETSVLTFSEREYLIDALSTIPEVETIAVIEPGCGGVSGAFLELTEDVKVVSFATCVGGELSSERHEVIKGDPLKTVLTFAKERPFLKFDLIFIALKGAYRDVLRIIFALRGLSHDHTLIIFTGAHLFNSHLPAWQRCKEKGVIKELNSFTDIRGYCWKEGHYLYPTLFTD